MPAPSLPELDDAFPDAAAALRYLAKTDAHFVRLAQRYRALTAAIREAEAGVERVSHAYLDDLRQMRDYLLGDLAEKVAGVPKGTGMS